MFEHGGHRAVEVMLRAVAACLNYYLVEYIKARNLPIISVDVKCDAEMPAHRERVSTIVTRVKIEGQISERERRKMVTMCDRGVQSREHA